MVQDIDKFLNNTLTTGIKKTSIETRKGLIGKLTSLLKEYNIDITPCIKRKQVNGKRKKFTDGYMIEIDAHFKNLAMGIKSHENVKNEGFKPLIITKTNQMIYLSDKDHLNKIIKYKNTTTRHRIT